MPTDEFDLALSNLKPPEVHIPTITPEIAACYAEDGEPLQCFSCGSTDLTDKVEDVVQGVVCEKTRVCKTCNKRLSSWAYGYWETYF